MSIKNPQGTIYFLGRWDSPKVTHCKSIISDLLTKSSNLPRFNFKLFFETEFEEERAKLQKENLSFLKYPNSPIIYFQKTQNSPKEIIGSLEQFQQYLVQHFRYRDIKKTEKFEYETKEKLRNFLHTNGNKYVYMDFIVEGEDTKFERVVFELYNSKCPLTVKNFYSTCIGFSNELSYNVSYTSSTIHRISRNSFIQGGDINVEGNKTIYGKEFNDENYDIEHNKPYIIGMVKRGNKKHTNGCQFYITLCPLKSFDRKFVAFGRVIQGFETINKIGDMETNLQRPKKRVSVKESGEYTIG